MNSCRVEVCDMPMIFVNESQRQWLERLAEERRIPWLLTACRLEDPKRRGLPETHWIGAKRIK